MPTKAHLELKLGEMRSELFELKRELATERQLAETKIDTAASESYAARAKAAELEAELKTVNATLATATARLTESRITIDAYLALKYFDIEPVPVNDCLGSQVDLKAGSSGDELYNYLLHLRGMCADGEEEEEEV